MLFTSRLAYPARTKGLNRRQRTSRIFLISHIDRGKEGRLPSKYILKGFLHFFTLTLLVTLKLCQGHLAGRCVQQISNSLFDHAVPIPILKPPSSLEFRGVEAG
jgi:hypothetical protein